MLVNVCSVMLVESFCLLMATVDMDGKLMLLAFFPLKDAMTRPLRFAGKNNYFLVQLPNQGATFRTGFCLVKTRRTVQMLVRERERSRFSVGEKRLYEVNGEPDTSVPVAHIPPLLLSPSSFHHRCLPPLAKE